MWEINKYLPRGISGGDSTPSFERRGHVGMTTSQHIQQALKGALAKIGYDQAIPLVTLQDIPEFGDYSSNAPLVFGKIAKKNPIAFGEELKTVLMETGELKEIVDRIEVAKPGFLNFYLSEQYVASVVNEVVKKPENFGKQDEGKGKLVIVEYFQNNIAKPPHIGHIRSGLMGDALVRLYERMGYTVITDSHVGDWGTQFGILLYGYKQWGDRTVVDKDPINELNKLYVRANNEIKEKPEIRDLGKAEFKKLEDGDSENRALWQWFVDVSMVEFEIWRKRLGLRAFDHHFGESFYEPFMPDDIKRMEEAGLLTKGETGELYVDLEKEKLGRCIIVKSDGATTYHTRDISTYIYQQQKFDFYKRLYVIDVRQSHHFRQLFKVLDKLGYDTEHGAKHVSYGFMKLPEGAMSTRKGTVVRLEELFEQAEAKALEIIKEKNPELSNIENVAKDVALGALKFFDLSHEPGNDIVFTWDKVLSFEGFTGPYVQYTYARLSSILRKAGDGAERNLDRVPEESKDVLRTAVQFPDVVLMSAHENDPHRIAEYVYELCQKANSFYHSKQILSEPNEMERTRLLIVVSSIRAVIGECLRILGIPLLEEM